MSRPAGKKNADYEQAREAILFALRPLLLSKGGARASFRELALSAEVSPNTLRHYFGTREATIAAVLESLHRAGQPHLDQAATAPHGKVRESLAWLLQANAEAWVNFGVGASHGLGITAGLGDPELGPAYVSQILEPTLQSAETRLARHMEDGELERCDLRHAALELMSPLLMALLHQESFFGSRCRPLDLEKFLEDHLERFLRAHGAKPASSPRR